MDNTILSQLKALGLSEKEAIVYLTLLGMTGAARVQEIATASRIHRSTTYILLKTLLEKNFIRIRSDKPGSFAYETIPPEMLLKKAEKSVAQAETDHAKIIEVTRDLSLLISESNGVPHAVFFETIEGIRALQQEIAAVTDAVLRACIHTFTVNNALGLTKTRNMRVLLAYNELPSSRQFPDFLQLIPANKYPFDSDVFIFKNIIALISETEKFAVRIESEPFAEVAREMFDLAWGEGLRLNSILRGSNKSKKGLPITQQ